MGVCLGRCVRGCVGLGMGKRVQGRVLWIRNIVPGRFFVVEIHVKGGGQHSRSRSDRGSDRGSMGSGGR